MNGTTKKNWWYLIFFLIGVLSLPLGLFLMGILSFPLSILQSTLCDLGIFCTDILALSQFLFPFLMCSILLAVVLYFKERSFAFALKVFVISFAAISLLFFGGLSFLNLIQPPINPFLIFLLILLILFIIGLIAFKEHPLLGFTIRAFALLFAVALLAISAWFMWSAGEHEYAAISITKFDTPQGAYAEVTADELKGLPALEKALSGEGCTKFDENSWYCKVDPDDWRRTLDFIIRKKQSTGGAPLFKINEKYYKIDFMIS